MDHTSRKKEAGISIATQHSAAMCEKLRIERDALLAENRRLQQIIDSHNNPTQTVSTLSWTRQRMRAIGHTCILTQATVDGSVPAPCRACERGL
jgi:hypothetical protein